MPCTLLKQGTNIPQHCNCLRGAKAHNKMAMHKTEKHRAER